MSTPVLSLPFTGCSRARQARTGRSSRRFAVPSSPGLLDLGVRGARAASLWIRPAPWAPLQILIAGALTPVPAAPRNSAPGG